MEQVEQRGSPNLLQHMENRQWGLGLPARPMALSPPGVSL